LTAFPKKYLLFLAGGYGRLAAALMALLLLIVLAASLGPIPVSWQEALRVILANVTGHAQFLGPVKAGQAVVVWDVRLPRILSAVVVGAALAASGTVYQGILLNPLADPYTLGVSAGAAFGASLALLMNGGMVIGGACGLSVPVFSFGGACAALAVVVLVSSSAHDFSSTNLILAGIMVTAILSAAISLVKYIADEQVSVIIFWLMGSFVSRTWADVRLTGAATLAGALVCLYYSRELNLLTLGRRSAASLGVETRRLPLVLLTAASMMAAVCVSVSGIIGFVGLLVPHMMRGLVGADNGRLLPMAMTAGAFLLLLADTFTRAVLPHEIPIGVLTALIGGPFFCWVLFRRRRREGGGFQA
jgi:iron complex transport system permease protein